MHGKLLMWCGVAAGLLLGTASADAGLTDVRPAASGEVGHEQILEHVYGGDFQASGADFVGNNVAVRRVNDDSDGKLRFDAPGRIDLVAAFTGWQWDYSMRSASGNEVSAASQSGSGFNVGGGIDVPATGAFDMVLSHASGRRFSSSDSLDQLVTYEVTGSSGDEQTLLFWEDWSRVRGSDANFNDLVFRVSSDEANVAAAAESPVTIPLPAAAWPGFAGLLGVGTVAIRRFRRR